MLLGDEMIVYLDLVILINYFFDCLLLMVVNITLKRNISLKRILLSSLLGELSLLGLFINNIYLMFIFKLILAISLIIVCFKFKDILYTINNLIYFYVASIILGGFTYYLELNGINYLLIIIISPLILYLFCIQTKLLKTNYKDYYNVTIYFKNSKSVKVAGYLDTGNKLKDPVTGKCIVLLDRRLLKGVVSIRSPIYVPYHSLNNRGLVKCIRPNKIEIENKFSDNFLLGIMDDKIGINGVECILNLEIMESLHV